MSDGYMGDDYYPDFKWKREIPLAGELGVDKLQVLPKRDVDAALSTAKDLSLVVAALSKRVEYLADRWASAKQQLAELVALHHAELKQRDEEFAERIAKLEARLNNRH